MRMDKFVNKFSKLYKIILIATLVLYIARLFQAKVVFLLSGIGSLILFLIKYKSQNKCVRKNVKPFLISFVFFLTCLLMIIFIKDIEHLSFYKIFLSLLFTIFIICTHIGLYGFVRQLDIKIDILQLVLNLFSFYAVVFWSGEEALTHFFNTYVTVNNGYLYYLVFISIVSEIFTLSLTLCLETVKPPKGIVTLISTIFLTFAFCFFYLLNIFSGRLIYIDIASVIITIITLLNLDFSMLSPEDFKPEITIEESENKYADSKVYFDTLSLSAGFLFIILIPILLFAFKEISINRVIISIIISSLYYILSLFYLSFTVKRNLLQYHISLNAIKQAELEQKKNEILKSNEILINQSHTDYLTGTWNREKFYLDANKLIDSHTPFTLIYLDLDRFKVINDTYGHDTGDVILKETAQRFKRFSNDITSIYRVGGDEFTVLSKIVDREKLTQFSLELINIVQVPYLHNNTSYYIGLSIGISEFPKDSCDVDTLIKYADFAMYRIKKSYVQNKIEFFTQDYYLEIERKNRLIKKLENSDFNEILHLNYQPIFYPGGKKIKKVEALLRWHDEEFGYVSPAEFIPLAEQTNIIFPITQWVIDKSFSDLLRLKKEYHADFSIAINISPKTLTQNPLIYNLLLKSSYYGLDNSQIELELTENFSVYLIDYIKEKIHVLDQNNFTISIDDFGTGYSSLEYLKDLKIDTLKIAKELVDNIEEMKQDYSLIASIISLSKALNLEVIAEGVEHKGQLEILESLGCDLYQGYYYERPVSFDALVERYLQPDNLYNIG